MGNNGLELIYDAKDIKSFHSAVWNTDTNPDLCFVSESLAHNNVVKRFVHPNFPRSQHRPIVIDIEKSVHVVQSLQKPRWNFKKADWISFGNEMDYVVNFIPPKIENYTRFINKFKLNQLPRSMFLKAFDKQIFQVGM